MPDYTILDKISYLNGTLNSGSRFQNLHLETFPTFRKVEEEGTRQGVYSDWKTKNSTIFMLIQVRKNLETTEYKDSVLSPEEKYDYAN